MQILSWFFFFFYYYDVALVPSFRCYCLRLGNNLSLFFHRRLDDGLWWRCSPTSPAHLPPPSVPPPFSFPPHPQLLSSTPIAASFTAATAAAAAAFAYSWMEEMASLLTLRARETGRRGRKLLHSNLLPPPHPHPPPSTSSPSNGFFSQLSPFVQKRATS